MSFLDEVEKVPSETIQAKFFNVNNSRQLKSLQDKFPEQFDLLKQGKLKDIADAAIDFSQKGKGETNTANFLKEVRSLTPEFKKHYLIILILREPHLSNLGKRPLLEM